MLLRSDVDVAICRVGGDINGDDDFGSGDVDGRDTGIISNVKAPSY